MKHFLATITLILFLSFIISCNSDVKSGVEGMWSIDTISYKGYDIKLCLTLNVISFDRRAQLPTTGYRCSELITVFDPFGDWEISNKDNAPLSLRIESKNQLFAGEHQIKFKRNPRNQNLTMEIISPDLYVTCNKFLFSCDENEALVNRLIMLSNKRD